MSTVYLNGNHRNTAPPEHTPHVVIVGSGITGLTAAYTLQREAEREGIPLGYTMLEASDRWGGKIWSSQLEPGNQPMVIEHGADALLTRKPWAFDLARELGLEDRMIPVNHDPVQGRTFVLRRGQLVPLPEGLSLLVPTKLGPFLRSPLFSPLGKLRMFMEQFVPKREGTGDESLAAFVRRRLGREALDRLGEPLLAGIYNADAEQLSMQATFPQFPAMEQQHGSLLRAARATQNTTRKTADRGDRPAFISFRNGTQELIDALVSRLTGDRRLNTPVTGLKRMSDGRYELFMGDARLEADAVLLTLPANIAAPLVRPVAPDASGQLANIRYNSIGSISLVYRREDVPHSLNGLGVVIPPSEGRPIDGITFGSTKWPGRAPENRVLLRVFFGGPHSRATFDFDDAALLRLIHAELWLLLGIQAKPLAHTIHRWRDGYPQYDLGHMERVNAIEASLPHGLTLAGSAYRGIGVPDCVRQGQEAARHMIDYLKQPEST